MSGPERRDPPTWAIISLGLLIIWAIAMITVIVWSIPW